MPTTEYYGYSPYVYYNVTTTSNTTGTDNGNWFTTTTPYDFTRWVNLANDSQDKEVQIVEKEVVKLVEPASGVWKDTDRDVIVCSECGYETQYVTRSKRYRYCPNCGAKMKPEE